MTNKKSRAGFTLAELLLAIAILVILFGIGFVAVTAYLKDLRLNEMNWTAKEIFIASQNQLSKAKEKGTLDSYLTTYDGAEPHYVIYNAEEPPTEEARYAWKLLMPFGAIDDTVRLSGKYIIEFNAKSATVTKVFYTTEAYSKGFSFTDDHYIELKPKLETEPPSLTKDEQKNFHGNNIIGAYGGNPEFLDFEQIEDNLKLEVDNLEKLIAKISGAAENGRKVLLCIKGLSSEATTTINVSEPLDRNYILDDVTSANMHFAKRVKSSVLGKEFIPGENIEVFVTVSAADGSGDVIFSNVLESNHVITNSLFASADFENGGTTAQIANFRHLENLDSLISGIDYGKINATKAEQIADLYWNGFLPTGGGIVPLTGSFAAGSYYPVKFAVPFEYNGKNRLIDGVVINTSGISAGIFGDVSGKLTVRDLELRNFNISVTGTGSNAGALVGNASSELIVNNVIAYNTEPDPSKEALLQISSAGNTGGLIGSASNATVSNSVAAVYVKGVATAGGLVGNLDAGTVSNSYVGGHTSNGVFILPPADDALSAGRPNVWATTGTAGGFIGSSGATISNSYTTASVYSSSGTANLFTGNNDAVPTGCYAAGWSYKDGKIVFPTLNMSDFVPNATMNPGQESEYNYDSFWDNDYYPYEIIGNNDVWFLKTHVGDWALPGNLIDIVND